MPFDELVNIRTTAPKKAKAHKLGERGCDACPLDKVKGIQKIMGRSKGREILIVGQSPGPVENREGREFVGDSGDFLWGQLKEAGIERRDCDIFNVVRCFPADRVEGTYSSRLKMRNPSAKEIHCCSIHTETAMQESKAKYILVLGQIAAKAFLQTRSVPKQKIFWSEKHKAKIYLADHPSYFVRGYGAGARLEGFRGTMRRLAADWRGIEVQSDDVAYLRKQDYRLVVTAEEARAARKIIKQYAEAGRRTSFDIEYDIIDGKKKIFIIGASPKSGLTFVHILGWPAMPQSADNERAVWLSVQSMLEDANLPKVFHYGCSDVEALEEAGVTVRGFDWDTFYSEYLYYPDAKAFGLAAVAERRFQDFSGYKAMVLPELLAAVDEGIKIPSAVLSGGSEAKSNWLARNGQYKLSRLKPETMRLYNGADADLCKRIEVDTKKKVPVALVKLYIDLSFVLRRMEFNGPYFDKEYADCIAPLYPILAAKKLKKLRKAVGDPEFNPSSHQQVFDLIYNKLELAYPLSKGKPNTRKQTLMMLSREHPVPLQIVEWRKLDKANSTLEGYAKVAEQFNGRLRTTWKAEGTGTGRLSSSGGNDGGTNLQNVSKDPQMQNVLVAEPRWREVYAAIKALVDRCPAYKEYSAYVRQMKEAGKKPQPADGYVQPQRDWLQKQIERWIRQHMPDLMTFLVLDYGQIEVRVMGQLSGDKNLLKDCEESDIHTVVGCIAEGQRVLTDYGLVCIEKVQGWMRVWDGNSFVTHDGVICRGKKKVISYEGLRATPDHEVWTDTGERTSLAAAHFSRARLVVTGVAETPVGYTDHRLGTNSFQESESSEEVLVFDILNAGPNHRFTVEGHLVANCTMTGWDPEKIKHDKPTRTLTKNCHFGMLFGLAKKNLYDFIKAMDPTSEVTEEFVFNAYDRYFERYQGVKKYMEDQIAFAQEHGYVETLFGLHRALNITERVGEEDEYVDEDGKQQVSWRGQSVNSPVQGTAHQLMECGLVAFKRIPEKYEVLGVPTMEVHDALYMRVKVLELIEAYQKARYLLEKESLNIMHQDFPLIDWKAQIVVEAEAGLRLGTKVTLEEGKFTVGSFMLDWFEESKTQVIELNQKLREIDA